MSIEAFVTGGLADFRQNASPFEVRDSSVSGGVSSTADFGFVNGSFAYEHRAAYANTYSIWKSTGDKIGASFNKTFPFFVPALRVTPQLVTARESVVPTGGSAISVDPTVGFSYKASERLSFAASGGEGLTFLYAVPGYRHNNGLKFSVGATYKISNDFVATVGAGTNRTILYGLPQYRADGSLSPNVNLRYSPISMLSFTLSASYARFLSNVSGSSTFKYNLNPAVSLTVPR